MLFCMFLNSYVNFYFFIYLLHSFYYVFLFFIPACYCYFYISPVRFLIFLSMRLLVLSSIWEKGHLGFVCCFSAFSTISAFFFCFLFSFYQSSVSPFSSFFLFSVLPKHPSFLLSFLQKRQFMLCLLFLRIQLHLCLLLFRLNIFFTKLRFCFLLFLGFFFFFS